MRIVQVPGPSQFFRLRSQIGLNSSQMRLRFAGFGLRFGLFRLTLYKAMRNVYRLLIHPADLRSAVEITRLNDAKKGTTHRGDAFSYLIQIADQSFISFFASFAVAGLAKTGSGIWRLNSTVS